MRKIKNDKLDEYFLSLSKTSKDDKPKYKWKPVSNLENKKDSFFIKILKILKKLYK